MRPTPRTRLVPYTGGATIPLEDYVPGDPAGYVLGRAGEQPARVHRPLPPRRPTPTAKTILADIKLRRQLLEPVVAEYHLLRQADNALEGI